MNEMTLKEFLIKSSERFSDATYSVLKSLQLKGPMNDGYNMSELSIISKINRESVPAAIAPLEVLGLIEMKRFGQAKVFSINQLGIQLIEVIEKRFKKLEYKGKIYELDREARVMNVDTLYISEEFLKNKLKLDITSEEISPYIDPITNVKYMSSDSLAEVLFINSSWDDDCIYFK